MANRLGRLLPVILVYAGLLVLSALGYVLAAANSHAHALWLVFYLIPFSIAYCVPFGMGVGILAQRLVWYTASYGHRVVALGSVAVLVAMLVGWGGQLFTNFDIVYLAAIIWPTLASAVSMLIGMFFTRAKEYEEASAYEEFGGYDDYGADVGDGDYYENVYTEVAE